MTDENTKLKKDLKLLLNKKNLNARFPLEYVDLLSSLVGKDNIIVNSSKGYAKMKHCGDYPTAIIKNLREAGENEISEMPYFQALDKHRKNKGTRQKQKFNTSSMEGGGNTLEELLKDATSQKSDDSLYYLEVPGSENLRL
tara:strand:- start:516 stop:938 length:423 start_codon:yes stop_codon:yes gene_type:complete